MVDVSAKADTARIAVAAGELRTTAEVITLVRADDMPKADVLSTARLAGISGAKKTSELIPLCHQLALTKVDVRFGFTADTITIEATAKTTGPTGVEMEALTAVAVAGLTLHDMVKAVDPAAVLNNVRLLTKDGGKRGHWERPEAQAAGDSSTHAHPEATAHLATSTATESTHVRHSAALPDATTTESAPTSHETTATHHGHESTTSRTGSDTEPSGSRTAVVVVASTGVAAGTRVDKTGPVLRDWLAGLGFSVRGPLVCADADIAAGLADALGGQPGLVITTGGTGASPTDATPEATRGVLDRELPGVAEQIRLKGTATFPLAALSRGIAGLAGRTVLINLPGSPGGVRDGIAVLEPLLDHLLAQVAGGGSHD
ncbi:bifunctional molybdenum cofactor biosynthesis protein MoaC/MoaB [Nocardia sp. CA2R105]|uniref:bifunctional molybdenum cofactor biosynthesis protein MoaC/MoaB n=1 Tax=Nocardia coffeae TaxID=2873381 RepID=UPI001CA70203|nr:bifunctional molybdenum cofactor biosynthesis protein MoaC/MoaB [Nocardia coffeae]